MHTYQITNPVKPGDEVVIPKGVSVSDGYSTSVSKRKYTVTVHNVFQGSYSAQYEDRRHLPSISWAGSSGKWREIQITQEFLDANPSIGHMEVVPRWSNTPELTLDDIDVDSLLWDTPSE